MYTRGLFSRTRPALNDLLIPPPMELNRPLARASANAYNQSVLSYQRAQKQQQHRRFLVTLSQFSMVYYRFPKIPRPHRNVLYYSLTSTTLIAGSIRRFSIRTRSRKKGGSLRSGVLAKSRRLFGHRRSISTKTAAATKKKFSKRRALRYFTLTAITIIFFGVIGRFEESRGSDDDDRDGKSRKRTPIRPTNVLLYVYSQLPLNTLSRLWGQVNRIELPVWMRSPSFKFYSWCFGVNLDEMADPVLVHYRNLAEFFYRTVKPGVRPVDEKAQITSPCDGRIIKLGLVQDGEIEQVKGMTYKVEALLGTSDSSKLAQPAKAITYPNEADSKKFLEEYNARSEDDHANKLVSYQREGDKALIHPSVSEILTISSRLYQPKKHQQHQLYYAVIYLDPGDYHHFHSPANWIATTRRHFAGELYSVAPYFQRTFNDLFVLNERVALLGYWKHGFFSMTPVGATNVGSIKVNFDKDLSTNVPYKSDGEYPEAGKHRVKKNTCYEATYSKASKVLGGVPLFKGEEMGGFMLGSTIVLCFEAPSTFQFSMKEGDHVKMGQRFGGFD